MLELKDGEQINNDKDELILWINNTRFIYNFYYIPLIKKLIKVYYKNSYINKDRFLRYTYNNLVIPGAKNYYNWLRDNNYKIDGLTWLDIFKINTRKQAAQDLFLQMIIDLADNQYSDVDKNGNEKPLDSDTLNYFKQLGKELSQDYNYQILSVK
jgi:hypothetical protein